VLVIFRLVVSDIDGTLLDEQGMLRQQTRRAVQKVQKAGIAFALATSRRWTGAEPVAHTVGFPMPLIIYDGIQIRSYPSGEVMAQEGLDSVVAGKAALALASRHLTPILQYSDSQVERLVVGLLPDESLHHSFHTGRYLSTFKHQVQELPLEEVAHPSVSPLRLATFGPYDQLIAVTEELAHLECGWQILPQGSYGAAELTVFAPGVSKGTATLELCRQLGISPEEVFAIGDGPNDLTLLRMAGLGVAMGNASAEVKAVARAVAPSNQENGVAVALEQFVLSG
jgi:Cof subfamily protein (haloacid dehalogenase superfamily)